MHDQESVILINAEVLCDRHIPEDIYSRQDIIKEFLRYLYPLTEGRRPINCWFHGRTGTGKTATGKWIQRKLEREFGIKGIYVNCWENPTFYSMLDYIAREVRMLGAEKLSTSFKLDRLKRHIANERLIIFLDEIDQSPPRERNAILYTLADLPSVGLICASNSQHAYFDLEERVKSRLNPARVIFKAYTTEEMIEILSSRVIISLAPKTCSNEILNEITDLSAGDARLAIKTLTNAAYLAEKDRRVKIEPNHVTEAWNFAKDVKKTYLLNALTDTHKLLFELIKKNPGILSGDLWRLYLKTCHERNLDPIAMRTYSDYCNKLVELKLVRSKRAAIQGKVREFYPI
jgi:archaeal cell division control protein 6